MGEKNNFAEETYQLYMPQSLYQFLVAIAMIYEKDLHPFSWKTLCGWLSMGTDMFVGLVGV